MTPGAYLKKRREAARLSIDDVARVIETEPRYALHLRKGWLELIESDETPAAFNTVVALHQVVPFDLDVLIALSIEGREAPRLCPDCAAGLDDDGTCRLCADTAEIDALVGRVESAAGRAS
jgi:transcriptional regulator with XRE-family HTH domain